MIWRGNVRNVRLKIDNFPPFTYLIECRLGSFFRGRSSRGNNRSKKYGFDVVDWDGIRTVLSKCIHTCSTLVFHQWNYARAQMHSNGPQEKPMFIISINKLCDWSHRINTVSAVNISSTLDGNECGILWSSEQGPIAVYIIEQCLFSMVHDDIFFGLVMFSVGVIVAALMYGVGFFQLNDGLLSLVLACFLELCIIPSHTHTTHSLGVWYVTFKSVSSSDIIRCH